MTSNLMKRWGNLPADLQSTNTLDTLDTINRFFNDNIRWMADIDNWKEKDYWATPSEMIERGAGDCEDLAIAKYLTAIDCGVKMDRMRIDYVELPMIRQQSHMVLTVHSNCIDEPLVLDNMTDDVNRLCDRRDIRRVYSFNHNYLWVGEKQRLVSTSPVNALSNWKELLQKL